MEIKKGMEFDRIKQFLQDYLDTVVLPVSNSERSEPLTMDVKSILKGSYQPPIIHVFINVEPHWTPRMSLSGIERDISNFFKVFSINSKVKIHWNKSPNLKGVMEL
jgi:hypothetical protein